MKSSNVTFSISKLFKYTFQVYLRNSIVRYDNRWHMQYEFVEIGIPKLTAIENTMKVKFWTTKNFMKKVAHSVV